MEFFFFFPLTMFMGVCLCLQTEVVPCKRKQEKAKPKGEMLDYRLQPNKMSTRGLQVFYVLQVKKYEFTFMSTRDVLISNSLCDFMTFRRDSPSSPPSKKAKGIGPRNTIDKFFR